MKGFKNFLMQGELIVIAVGLVVALAFSTLIMAVVYYAIVVPYRSYMARLGTTVFGQPAPTKECPQCCSGGLPIEATKCKFCASELSA